MVLPNIDRTRSYWIEAAESELKHFRSTESLPLEIDVVIVGSGYSGATTAYWLSKYTSQNGTTPSMLLLEARDICGSATGRNGGQLRPHAYSRYNTWKSRFGPKMAMALIKHEMAHLPAFKNMLAEEGITEEVCCKFGDTFDAAMTEEAWERLTSNLLAMRQDHGVEDDTVKMVKLIEVAEAAELFTQMKGAIGAIVHPAGQIWPYKFVHALLRIIMKTEKLNLQANTPAERVSARDADGWITVETARGCVKTRAVVHATNRWAAHLLPEFEKLIYPGLATVAAIKAPEGLFKHTGAEHWDSNINNYHVQLPHPYNTIMLGGAQSVLAHNPAVKNTDGDDARLPGVAEYMQSWPSTSVLGWPADQPTELALPADEGGNWTGVEATTSDSFPFIGPMPDREGHFVAAGFNGHGMPRILLSTAHVTPLVLEYLQKWVKLEIEVPELVKDFPALPGPFIVTGERIARLQDIDMEAKFAAGVRSGLESAEKPFCTTSKGFYEAALKERDTLGAQVDVKQRSDSPIEAQYDRNDAGSACII